MINFVVVSHNKKLVDEAIRLAMIMPHEDFKIVNAGGLPDCDDFGTDPMYIMEKINEVNEGDGVLIFCELGSSQLNSAMAVDMLSDESIRVVNAPLVEGLVIGLSANAEGVSIDELEKEIEEIKDFNKK